MAEPLTGLVDTAFIARLGAVPLAALGVGAATLSSLFWIFNFLGIGTQTEVAQAVGSGEDERVCRMAGLSIFLGLVFGLLLAAVVWPLTSLLAVSMGAGGQMQLPAVAYIHA
ncbi:MAG: MATE family efflux transporter, partial [Desulfosarcinaceae bacterium]